jgi:hypothetical protein
MQSWRHLGTQGFLWAMSCVLPSHTDMVKVTTVEKPHSPCVGSLRSPGAGGAVSGWSKH